MIDKCHFTCSYLPDISSQPMGEYLLDGLKVSFWLFVLFGVPFLSIAWILARKKIRPAHKIILDRFSFSWYT
jgi:hypothetical protein